MATTIEELALKLGADISDYQRKLAAAAQQMSSMSEKFSRFSDKMSNIGRSLSLVAGGMAAGMSYMAGQYNNAMNEVWSITDKSQEGMQQWRDQVLRLSSDIGVSATGQAKALYQVISAGVKTSDAMQVLTVSAKAAKAGFADQAQVVDALTSVMNVYGLQASEATKITDVLFTTVKLGKLNMNQLAGSIGTILPVAKQAGVSFDEVATAMAFLTKRGLSSDRAATAFRATLLRIISATDEQKRKAKELGFEFSLTALKTKGLTKFFDEMRQAIGKNPEAIKEVFQSEEALGAAFELATASGKEFNAMLGDMKNSSGATEDALRKLSQASEDTLTKALENIKNTMIVVGTALREQWAAIYRAMEPFVGWIEGLIQKFPFLSGAIINCGIAIGGLSLGIAAVSRAGMGLLAVFNLLRLHPAFALLMAIGAIAGSVISIINSLQEAYGDNESPPVIDITKEWAEAENRAAEARRRHTQEMKDQWTQLKALTAAWDQFVEKLQKATPSKEGELDSDFSAIRARLENKLTAEQQFTQLLREEYRKREKDIRDRLEWEINEAKKYREFDAVALDRYLREIALKHWRLTEALKKEQEEKYRRYVVLEKLELKAFELVTQKRVKLYQEEMRKRAQAAQEMFNRVRSIEQQLMDLARARQQWSDSMEDALSRIRMVGMTDEQKWNAEWKMANRYSDKAETAAAAGDYERAEAYAQRAMSMFEGLAREVRDANGNVVISLKDGFDAAEAGLVMLDRLMQGIYQDREFKLFDDLRDAKTRLEELKKEFDDFQAKAEKELTVKFKTDDAKKKLQDLKEEFLKVAKELSLTITASVNGQNPEKHASGGWVGGAAGIDKVPAMLSRGEFVVNAQAAARNSSILESINSGRALTAGPLSRPSGGTSNITIVVNERLTREYIRDVLAPEIQRSASRRRN